MGADDPKPDDPKPHRGSGTQAFGTPAPVTPEPRPPQTGSQPPSSTPDAKTQMQFGPDDQEQGDPLIGQTLVSRYLIEKKLGEGGMGSVYLAKHTLLEKTVALKVLHGEFARKPDLIERFLQEAKAASKIRHEHVIDITDFGQTDDGLVFFAMELLDGKDLAEELGAAYVAGTKFPWERTRNVFLQVCAALSVAHKKGIIHRDLKPENIYLISRFGEGDFVKLLDFGIAKVTEATEQERKLTRTGMLFGTPEYMSPEQARGEKVDHRVDVYAMGCILYQMIAGRVPFEADNFMGILTLHLTQETPKLGPALAEVGAPPGLEDIVQKALAKDREQRYADIDQMMDDILALDDGLGADLPAPRHARTPTTGVPAAEMPEAGTAKTQWKGQVKLPVGAAQAAGEPAGSKTGLFIALGGVAVIGVVVAAFALGGGGEDPATASAGEPAVEQPVVEPDPTATPPTPIAEQIAIHIETDPPGAQVINGSNGEVLGTTPYDVTADKGPDTTTYELKLDGYKTATAIVSHSSDFHRSFELAKEKRRRPGRNDRDRDPDRVELPDKDGDKDEPSALEKAGGKNPFKND